MNISTVLKQLNLTDNEAVVYLALLDFDSASTAQVAERTGLKRTTTYSVLQSLAQQNLVAVNHETESSKRYVASDPSIFLQRAQAQLDSSRDLLGEVHNILPMLKVKMKGDWKKPKISFLGGKQGLIAAYEDTLTSSETIRAFASIGDMHNALPGYFPSYYQRRADKGISIRSVHPDTPEARLRVKNNQREARDSALVQASTYGFSPEINIYDNKITFMSLVEQFGFIIESEELAAALKQVFELAWKEAKRLDKSSANKRK